MPKIWVICLSLSILVVCIVFVGENRRAFGYHEGYTACQQDIKKAAAKVDLAALRGTYVSKSTKIEGCSMRLELAPSSVYTLRVMLDGEGGEEIAVEYGALKLNGDKTVSFISAKEGRLVWTLTIVKTGGVAKMLMGGNGEGNKWCDGDLVFIKQ